MKKLLALFLIIIFAYPFVGFAQGSDQITPIFCSLAKAIYEVGLAAVFICWAIVAVLFLISVGNPELLGIAKKGILVAVIGTVIILLGTSSLKLVEKAMGVARGGEDICNVGGKSGGCGEGECMGKDGICSPGNCN